MIQNWNVCSGLDIKYFGEMCLIISSKAANSGPVPSELSSRMSASRSLNKLSDLRRVIGREVGFMLRTPGSAHVLAVRPWHTGCLLYLATRS